MASLTAQHRPSARCLPRFPRQQLEEGVPQVVGRKLVFQLTPRLPRDFNVIAVENADETQIGAFVGASKLAPLTYFRPITVD
jgi:hypothetical protein